MAPPTGPARRIVQQLTAIWPDGHRQKAVCILELDKQHISIAALSSDGISLFNLNYDGKTVKMYKSRLLPDNFSPKSVIKDLQLVYWPVTELKKILHHPWQLNANANHRKLSYNGKEFAEIQYFKSHADWPDTAILTNQRYRYELKIITVSYESLPE